MEAAPLQPMPVWEPETGTHCRECRSKFSLFLWRHHCRSCGRLVCANCTQQAMNFWYNCPVLTCKTCLAPKVPSYPPSAPMEEGFAAYGQAAYAPASAIPSPGVNVDLAYTPAHEYNAKQTPQPTPSPTPQPTPQPTPAPHPSLAYAPAPFPVTNPETPQVVPSPNLERAQQFAERFGLPLGIELRVAVMRVTNVPPSRYSRNGVVRVNAVLWAGGWCVASVPSPAQLGTEVRLGHVLRASLRGPSEARLEVQADGELVLTGALPLMPGRIALPLTYVTPRPVTMPTPLAHLDIGCEPTDFVLQLQLERRGDIRVLTEVGKTVFRFVTKGVQILMTDHRAETVLALTPFAEAYGTHPSYAITNPLGMELLTVRTSENCDGLAFMCSSPNGEYNSLSVLPEGCWTGVTVMRGGRQVARMSGCPMLSSLAPTEDVPLLLALLSIISRVVKFSVDAYAPYYAPHYSHC